MNTKLTWTGDIDEALKAIGAERGRGSVFNDRHITCRRLKAYVFESDKLTEENLVKMQEVIQDRRPNLNVSVSRWDANRFYGNLVVYYRPKVGQAMSH